jgi:N-acetyl-anhydromuramyl-L-alanine amidase AmpD
VNVIDGRTLGLWFDIARKRPSTSYFVLHWTGGPNSGTVAEQAGRVFGTLVARGDSITYICCADGTIVQVADLDAHCVHAGSAMNDRAPGVEVVCPGSSGLVPTVACPKFTSMVHGAPVTYYGYTPAQVKAVAQLSQAVLWRYGLAYASSPVCVDDVMPASFKAGVVGHLSVSSDKSDPGPATMYQIRSALQDSKLAAGALAIGMGAAAYRFRHFRP